MQSNKNPKQKPVQRNNESSNSLVNKILSRITPLSEFLVYTKTKNMTEEEMKILKSDLVQCHVKREKLILLSDLLINDR